MKEIFPQVIYKADVLDAKVPYTINVNKNKLRQLLETVNVHEEAISRLTIVIGKNSKNETASFNYSGKTKIAKINIYGDDAWEEYEEASKSAKEIVEKKIKKTDRFENFLFTSKLPTYLSFAPKERGIAFADKLFRNGLNREINASLFHEIKHLTDTMQGKYRFWFKFGKIIDAITGVLIFLEKFDKAEKSAISFENQLKNDPKWRNILTIQPKK